MYLQQRSQDLQLKIKRLQLYNLFVERIKCHHVLCTISQPMCTFRGGHRRHHREHRSFRPKIALPWSVKFLKDNSISGSLEKRSSQVIDRKYIDAKVIEAHIVPGKLLLTRWLLYFFFIKNLLDLAC